MRGTQSPKSFNNHIGVPLTLLAAAPTDDFVVVEVGTNHPGEVAQLGAIVRPNAAVVVSIGREHLEAFGDVESVAAEELSLLKFVQPGGLALVPDAEWLSPWLEALPDKVTLQRIELQPRVLSNLALPGDHALHNASAAAQVAHWVGVSDDHMRTALAQVRPVAGRFEVKRLGDVTLIDDTYNANPDSVRAALTAVLQHWPDARRRVFVFGNMAELGEASVEAHREVGRWLAEAQPGFALLITVGPLATFAASELRRLKPTVRVYAAPQWEDDLPERMAQMLEPGDVVLLKGSRSMAMERLVPAIEAAFGNRPPGP